jgi:YVTN family beta-propeller protein
MSINRQRVLDHESRRRGPLPRKRLNAANYTWTDGSKVYVANSGIVSSSVSVIGTGTNNVVATVPVGHSPFGVAVTPDGSKVYVANFGDGTVSAIATASNTVIATIGVGAAPTAFGIFIQSKLFAGTPGSPNCKTASGSALAQQYGGLAAAGFPSVAALQNAITAFCKS